MKGYPKRMATKQDFINLLSVEEFRETALLDLKKIYNTQDGKCVQAVSGSEETGDLETKTIKTLIPLWKQKGFQGRKEVAELIAQNGGELT